MEGAAMRKTLIFNGSPRRNGDTAALLRVLTEALTGEYRVVDCYREKISPCIDYRSCRKEKKCVLNDAMQEIKRRLKIKYPDLLIATELPHEMFTDHPAERYYRINGAATPETTLHADITVMRCTGYLTQKTEDALADWQKKTGQRLVITYRTYIGEANAVLNQKDTSYYRIGAQAARIGDGFGFYSWNEMVDTHIVAEPDPEHPYGTNEVYTPEQSAAWKALASQQIKEFLSIAK